MTGAASRDALPPAVVLNMHYTGLALARALRAQGLRVHGVSSDPKLFGNVSRAIEFTQSPDTEREPQQCREFLIEFARKLGRRALLFPTRDHDLHFIRAHRAELGEHYELPLAHNAVLDRVLDKEQLFLLARELGVPCPHTVYVRRIDELEGALDSVTFPCVLKPVSASQWRKPGIWEAVGMRKAVIVETRAELEALYGRLSAYDPLVCLQDYIPGDDSALAIVGAYFDARSGARAWYTARKLLQYPAFAGTGVAVRSCAVPEIVAPSMQLLEALDYSGPAEIEFKYDPRHNDFKLIEINTRFWDQHALGAACGVDLVAALIGDRVHQRKISLGADGSTVTWIAEDGFLLSWFGNRRQGLQRPGSFREAWRGKRVFAVWSASDPLPALRLLGSLLAQAFAMLVAAVRR